MKDEIKEILEFKENADYKRLSVDEILILKDHINKLQEEVEDLREDNYAYHQLMRMENKREYRSKFLKEFQDEFGINTFPDYDEIYKRYDKLKKENERLKDYLKIMEKGKDNNLNRFLDYKSRNEKAIEYNRTHYVIDDPIKFKNDMNDILNGGDE